MIYDAISLFAGIGGNDLAFEQAGFRIVAQVEIDDYCTRVLEKHWPGLRRLRDVHDAGRHNLPACAVLIGSFPCQDISTAGRGAGIKEGTRSGLWFEFACIIGELRPRYVFMENVPPITSRGGTTVIANLTQMGHDAQWGIVAASDVGAPHRRERWWCVADALRPRLEVGQSIAGDTGQKQQTTERSSRDDVSHTDGELPNWPAITRSECDSRQIESRLGRIFDGLPSRLDAIRRGTDWPARPGEEQKEWEAPRTVISTRHRADRLKALGNAVVPQVVYPFAVGIREALEDEDNI